MLWRAEQAAQRAAMTDTPPTRVQPSVEVVDAPAADVVEQLERTAPTELAVEDAIEAAPEPPPVLSPADAALLAKMQQDPIRLVPDAELIAFVDRAGRSRTAPTVVADTEKLYARLDEQAAAIAAARELATELRRTIADYDSARSEHSALTERPSTAKRRERKTLEPAVDDARLREERLARQARDTQRAAQDAIGRVQAENSEWSAIAARAADPDRRAADLAAAAVFDTAITERGRRLRAVTLAGKRHAAEQRIRSAPATARLVEATAIDGVTDAVNRRSSDAKPADPDAQKNIARLLADAPGPGRPHSGTQTLQPEQLPDSVLTERQYDNDHGL